MASTPGRAKTIGRSKSCNPHEPEQSLKIMRNLLMKKFYPPGFLHDSLLATGNQELIEGNTWNDTFWGQCPIGVGKNHLGRLLMEIRKEMK